MVMTLSTALSNAQAEMPTSPRANALMIKAKSRVVNDLAAKKLQLGQPVFMRIFKMAGKLEVWMKKEGKYKLFKTYSICNYSGYPGPKLYEGDWQSPEGFYTVSAEQMNPNSLYHLTRGQNSFSLHIFPFRMTSRNMLKFNSSPWIGFWKNLQEGYNAFEMSHQVPLITAEKGKYLVNDQLKLAMTQDGKERQRVIR
jgi:murein L,D-transpeptidase YafK